MTRPPQSHAVSRAGARSHVRRGVCQHGGAAGKEGGGRRGRGVNGGSQKGRGSGGGRGKEGGGTARLRGESRSPPQSARGGAVVSGSAAGGWGVGGTKAARPMPPRRVKRTLGDEEGWGAVGRGGGWSGRVVAAAYARPEGVHGEGEALGGGRKRGATTGKAATNTGDRRARFTRGHDRVDPSGGGVPFNQERLHASAGGCGRRTAAAGPGRAALLPTGRVSQPQWVSERRGRSSPASPSLALAQGRQFNRRRDRRQRSATARVRAGGAVCKRGGGSASGQHLSSDPHIVSQ